uniref:Uncharacterized protein n=1 Tax=Arundo donax TaxID=35708 RepID=A0A0A8YYA6_ARUDO
MCRDAAPRRDPPEFLCILLAGPPRQEARRHLEVLRRLPRPQRQNDQGQVPDPCGRGVARRAVRRHLLHQAGPAFRVPPGPDASGQCQEDHLSDSRRPVRVPRHVVRPHQRTGYVSGADERRAQAFPPSVHPRFL